MIADLKSYPVMKDSGVPWLGAVPEHWAVRKLRTLLNRVTERNRPDLPLLSVVREKGVIRRNITSSDDNYNFIPDDLSNYKVVQVGQFAMNKMKAWQGSYGISQYDGIVSPAYFVFDLRGVGGGFFHSAVRSRAYVPFFRQASDGVRIGQWDLAQTRMNEIPFFVPPLPEQAAIVRFLDYMDRRIRKYIRVKQKLIRLLEEQKQAIIHRAVTRGLDPSVRLKPSGVEWLGDVPGHWQIATLVRLTTRIGDGLHGTPEYVDESEYHFINGNNLSGGAIKITPLTRCVSEVEFQKYKIALNDSTILMSINGTIGNVAFYRGESLVLGKSAAYINCDKSLTRSFLFFFLQSSAAKEFFRLELTGTTIFNLSLASIRNLLVALPPLTEQIAISSFLEVKMAEFTDLIDRAHREISLLREYRTGLITGVVTGKLDVREAAARLPDEADEKEIIDEIDESEDHATDDPVEEVTDAE